MSREIGKLAEDQALEYLYQHDFKLLQRNFLTKMGEIDLIGLINNVLVFVEVKARSRRDYGNAFEMVTKAKQRKIILSAEYFLQRNPKF